MILLGSALRTLHSVLRTPRFRNSPVFGDLRVNFTTKVTVVNFPSTDWLSYLRAQLKVCGCGRSLYASKARDFSLRCFLDRVCRIMLQKCSIMLSGVTCETRVLCSKLCSAGGMMPKLCRTKMTLPLHPIPHRPVPKHS